MKKKATSNCHTASHKFVTFWLSNYIIYKTAYLPFIDKCFWKMLCKQILAGNSESGCHGWNSKYLKTLKASTQETQKQTQFDLLPNKLRVSLWQVVQTFKNCEKREKLQPVWLGPEETNTLKEWKSHQWKLKKKQNVWTWWEMSDGKTGVNGGSKTGVGSNQLNADKWHKKRSKSLHAHDLVQHVFLSHS